MHRMSVTAAAAAWTVVAGALLAGISGCSRSPNPGAIYMSNRLPYEAQRYVESERAPTTMRITDVHGGVYLSSSEGDLPKTELQVTVFQDKMWDVQARLGDEGLILSSKLDRPFLLHTVSGEVPNVPLLIETGPGNVWLHDMHGQERIDVQTVKGMIRLERVTDVPQVELTSESGDIRLSFVSDAPRIVIRARSGNVLLNDVVAPNLIIETVDGNVTVRDSEVGKLGVRTTGGNLFLYGAEVETVDFQSETGQIYGAEGATIDSRSETGYGAEDEMIDSPSETGYGTEDEVIDTPSETGPTLRQPDQQLDPNQPARNAPAGEDQAD